MKSWQEFERFVKEILEHHGFSTKMRVIFRDEVGRSEIDVLAERYDIILAIDAKRYAENWYRLSAIKREARKHEERCRRYEKVINKKVVPVIVSLIDDMVYSHGRCIIVPIEKFNDFLININFYLEHFNY